MTDITSTADIKTFVDTFYSKIKGDPLLGPVFALRISEENWDQHLKKMYGFWNTVLFFGRDYKGNPFAKHIGLHVENAHFQQWVSLFHQTIDEHFSGDRADETKRRARNIAMMFMAKLEMSNG